MEVTSCRTRSSTTSPESKKQSISNEPKDGRLHGYPPRARDGPAWKISARMRGNSRLPERKPPTDLFKRHGHVALRPREMASQCQSGWSSKSEDRLHHRHPARHTRGIRRKGPAVRS